MTTDITWDNIEIDHVKANCFFVVAKYKELKKALSWKESQSLIKHDHYKKGTKFNFLVYQLQFIRAN